MKQYSTFITNRTRKRTLNFVKKKVINEEKLAGHNLNVFIVKPCIHFACRSDVPCRARTNRVLAFLVVNSPLRWKLLPDYTNFFQSACLVLFIQGPSIYRLLRKLKGSVSQSCPCGIFSLFAVARGENTQYSQLYSIIQIVSFYLSNKERNKVSTVQYKYCMFYLVFDLYTYFCLLTFMPLINEFFVHVDPN